jgi:16S rRNA (cytidine1402-2'-O)-methyltransferase
MSAGLAHGLWVVATPIGNLADISQRAIEVLGKVDRVLCEDTRRTGTLLRYLGLSKPLVSLHEHNEAGRVQQVIAWLTSGETLALVSDAGTPLISDPGYPLIAALRAASLPVHSVPGPCALVAALSVSGLPVERFCFEGFLPHKGAQKEKALKAALSRPGTVVFYESTHRILNTLGQLQVLASGRRVVLARELTKKFESVDEGTPADHLERMRLQPECMKGEFVVMLAPEEKVAKDDALHEARALAGLLLQEQVLPSVVSRILARQFGLRKRDCYALVQEIKPGPDDAG